MNKNKYGKIFLLIFSAVFFLFSCVTTGGRQIAVSPGNAVILAGETISLQYTLPAGALANVDGQPPVWISQDPGIAEITVNGRLKGIKQGSTVITVSSAGLSGSVKVTVAGYVVQLVNCWIEKTLYEKDGKAVYGTPAQNDPASQWILVDEKNYKRISNRGTGHELSIQGGMLWVECLPADPLSSGSLWKVAEGSIDGGYTFLNVKRPAAYLHVEGKKGYAECSNAVQPE
jgi:hypothetical protein